MNYCKIFASNTSSSLIVPTRFLFLILSIFCAINSVSAKKSPPAKKNYNVLFIAVDDLNNDMAVYAHSLVKTPNIDKLASKGVLFNRAYCQYTLCNPSRASLLTGLTPDQTKVYDLVTHFRSNVPDVITLPELYKQNNYYTARVGKIFHYDVPKGIGTSGLDDPISWQKVINPIGKDKTEDFKIKDFAPGKGVGGNFKYLESEYPDEEQTDGKVAMEAINLLRENKDKPFFLAVGFYRPHTPYVAPKKYFDMYPVESIKLPEFPANDLDDIPAPALFSNPPNYGLDQLTLKKPIQAYYACITFMDVQVGKVLDELERLKLADKTIVVFWSDHGYSLGEHGQWLKQTLFEKVDRVPLIIVAPGVSQKGKISNGLVELLDLYPTLAELSNLKAPKNVAGKSLTTLLKNPNASWKRPAFTQLQRKDIMGYSVRTDRWRYTEWDGGKAGVELYDYQTDPNEFTNLAKQQKYAATVQELTGLLKKYKQQ